MYFFKVCTCFVFVVLMTSVCFANKIHVVEHGETLGKIANQYCGNSSKWVDIYRTNKTLIKDANVIKRGWELKIPNCQDSIVTDEPPLNSVPLKIKFVTGNEYPPFTDEDLPNKGMITEIVETVFERLDKQIEIEWWGWNKGYQATEECAFVATFPYLKNKEREKSFYYSRPLFPANVLGFVKKGKEFDFNKRSDLFGKSFCKEVGYFTHDIQDLLDSNKADLVTVPDQELNKCFQMLSEGTVDVVPLSDVVAEGLFSKYGYNDNFVPLSKPIHEDRFYLMFSKNVKCKNRNMEILYMFDQELERMTFDGTLKKIQTKHMVWHKKLN